MKDLKAAFVYVIPFLLPEQIINCVFYTILPLNSSGLCSWYGTGSPGLSKSTHMDGPLTYNI